METRNIMNDEIRNQLSSLYNTFTPYLLITSHGYVTELLMIVQVVCYEVERLKIAREKMFFFFPHGFVKFTFLLAEGKSVESFETEYFRNYFQRI